MQPDSGLLLSPEDGKAAGLPLPVVGGDGGIDEPYGTGGKGFLKEVPAEAEEGKLSSGEILNDYLQRPFTLPETSEVGVGDNYYLGVYCVVFPS